MSVASSTKTHRIRTPRAEPAWHSFGSPLRVEAERAVRDAGVETAKRRPWIDGWLRGRYGEPARTTGTEDVDIAHQEGWESGHQSLKTSLGRPAIVEIHEIGKTIAASLMDGRTKAAHLFAEAYVSGRFGGNVPDQASGSSDMENARASRDGYARGRLDWRRNRDGILPEALRPISLPAGTALPLPTVSSRRDEEGRRETVAPASDPSFARAFEEGYASRFRGRWPTFHQDEGAYVGWRCAELDIEAAGVDYSALIREANSPKAQYSLLLEMRADERITERQRRILGGDLSHLVTKAMAEGLIPVPDDEFHRILCHRVARPFDHELGYLRDTGATDKDISALLSSRFGLGGGSSGGIDALGYSYKGGRTPSLSVGPAFCDSGSALKGKALVRMAREAWALPTPEERERDVEKVWFRRHARVRESCRTFLSRLRSVGIHPPVFEYFSGMQARIAGEAPPSTRWETTGWKVAQKAWRLPRPSPETPQLELFPTT